MINKTSNLDQWEVYSVTGKTGMIEGTSFKLGIRKYKTGVISVESVDNNNSTTTQYIKEFDQILSTFKFVN